MAVNDHPDADLCARLRDGMLTMLDPGSAHGAMEAAADALDACHTAIAELADVLGPILEHCDTHWQYRPAVAKARQILDAAQPTP